MTAILGYTKRQGENSIGLLYTDDLVDNRKAKVDKITKVANRFAITVAGREIVSSTLYWILCYFEQFSSPNQSITSIHDIERELSTFFPLAIKKIKENEISKNIEEQLDLPSIMVVLDYVENKLYFSNIGQIWRCDEGSEYKITFTLLEDNLYSFGAVAGKEGYIKTEFSEHDLKKIMNVVRILIITQNQAMPEYVGNLGSYLINVKGDAPYYSYVSCYKSVEDLLDNIFKTGT